MIVYCTSCDTSAEGESWWCERWRDEHHQMGHTTRVVAP